MKRAHALAALALSLGYILCASAFLMAARAHASPAIPATATPAPAGTPANASGRDLAALGYTEREFVVQGVAHSYTEGGTWASDGRWRVQLKQADQPYRTRILARYPSDPARFSGTVVVEWFNVTGFTDIEIDGAYMAEELLSRGHAWVGVSAQKTGLDGIKKTHPGRYDSLSIPSDSLSYDIFADVARLLRVQAPAGVLGGLPVRKLLATGQSQSGLRLTTYVNAFAPRERTFDAYLIHSRGSFPAGLNGLIGAPAVARIRTDLQVPVFQLETEFDTGPALFSLARQPDTPWLRTWEVAGSAHIDAYALSQMTAAQDAAGLTLSCAKPLNNLPFYRVEKAVLRHLQAWMTTGTVPPAAPPLRMAAGGTFKRDGVGNALGGVRLPEVEAPTLHYSLSNSPQSGANGTTPVGSGTGAPAGAAGLLGLMACTFLGSAMPLTPAQLGQLYSSQQAYIDRYTRAAQAAVAAGHLLPEDAETGIREARARAMVLGLP